ncbi:hypothetical protein GPJ56_002228 [Histomonas meleagridis]|uniref:uncharacterized protein n=1 Tax=Histomonas meleagridis TaxID=135588 RepID=UPI00355A984B|nr:hypothetical protein GPJ56_002228 [Histomonas meleagridis]KAH0802920.1 hypothetical protein GO595_004427 [Histomonas meleagridis]
MLEDPNFRSSIELQSDNEVSIDSIEAFKQYINQQSLIYSQKEEILKAEYEGKLMEMENQAITIQKELEERNKYVESIEEEKSKLKESALIAKRQQSDAEHKYQHLIHQLFQNFKCTSLDEIFKCSEKLISYENQIQALQKSFLETSVQLSKEMIRSDENIPNLNEFESLKIRLSDAISHISKQDEEVLSWKSKYEALLEQKEQLESKLSRVNIELKQAQQETKCTNEVNQRLFNELKEIRINQPKEESRTRLNIISLLSKRIDPNFISISRSSPLYPVFGHLSDLLFNASNIKSNKTEILNALTKVLETVQTAASQPFWETRTDESAEAKLEELHRQLEEQKKIREDLEDQLQEINERYTDMMNDDKVPYLLSLVNKHEQTIRDLERRLERNERQSNENESSKENLNPQLILPKKRRVSKKVSSPLA